MDVNKNKRYGQNVICLDMNLFSPWLKTYFYSDNK